MKSILTALTAGALVFAFTAQADDHNMSLQLEIEEWEVPYEGPRARDPWVAGEDEIWFAGQQTHYIGILTPSSGEFERVELDDGVGPHTVVVGDDYAWYAGNRAAHIGRIDRESHEIKKIELPGDGYRDVHTFDFTSDGNLWFSVQGGNQIGLFDTDSEEFTVYDVETEGARPYGVIVHEDQPWIALFGTHKLATVEDDELKEIELPREAARPRRLAVTDDGMVYYGDYAEGYIGRYNPENGEIDEWRAPGEMDSKPYAVTSDDAGRIWFVETGVEPNRFVAFDPETETFSQPFEVPSGGGTVRHMVFDEENNAIWFGTDMNTIGRATISE